MHFFYVSVMDGPRNALLAGPYDSHTEALAMVDAVRDRVVAEFPMAYFYAFGTAGSNSEMKTRYGKSVIL